MIRNLITTSVLTLALAGVGYTQGAASSAGTGNHFTQAQLKEMAHDAHTPDQYITLVSYYGEQQKSFLQLAAEEKKEWERRSQNVTGVLAKYPRPVDSARNLYEYYMEKASEAGTLEAKFNNLAYPTAPENAQ